ncbi:MAG: response regulator [Ilumatobacteraceae bacterium]
MEGVVMARDGATAGGRILFGGLSAAGLGAAVAVLVAGTARGGPFWSEGLQLSLFMLAAVAIAGLLGLIFAIPRSRTGAAPPPAAGGGGPAVEGREPMPSTTERFLANSNLEEISDWLTKILVGAGLVQLAALPAGLRALAGFLGDQLRMPNGPAVAIALFVYGAGVGFLFAYVWVRVRLRVMFEIAEREAAEGSRRRELTALLTAASRQSDSAESAAEIQQAASKAARSAIAATAPVGRILWVDDKPRNNINERSVLEQMGMRIDLATSTSEALAALQRNRYDLVISDLGRVEGGTFVADAGGQLLDAMKARGDSSPVIIYTNSEGMQRASDLQTRGAWLVTASPTELVNHIADLGGV